MKRNMTMISLIHRRLNKGADVPAQPTPVAAEPPPTIDNSEEVKKQRLLEQERQKNMKGLGSTDLVEGEGVPLTKENIDKKTLLGE